MESIRVVTPHKLSRLVKSDKALIIDSRTFCEFNTSHILNSINVWSSKIRKKRLQQDSISVHDYLQQACQVCELHEGLHIIVYDQNAATLSSIPQDSFLHVLLNKLGRAFPCVYLLAGGFLEFQARFPELCEDSSKKCTPLTSQSQPCLPVSTVGPTRILPFLYLGSQHDANNKQLLSDYNILYELNVSVSCPKPDFVQDSHFMRIPVNDNFSEKLLPYFNDAFNFIDKVRESGGCVLVHCLAGISRSATVAIAYVMKHLSLPFDEAYMYVKTRRPTISPNINFVGQLAELDRQLKRDVGQRDPSSAPILFRNQESHHTLGLSTSVSTSSTAFASSFLERHACAGLQTNVPKSLSLNLRSTLDAVPASPSSTPHTPDMSPSTALARLSFASALDELRDDGMPLTLKCSSPVTPLSSLPPSSPKTAVIRETSSSPIFRFRKTSESSSPSSPAFSSFYKSKEMSSRTSSDFKTEAKITSLKESFTCSDSIKSTSGSTSNFYSSATFNVGSAEERKEKVEERASGIVKSGRIRVEERTSGLLETGRTRVEGKDKHSEAGSGRLEEKELGRLEEKERNEKTVRPSTSTMSFTRRGSDRESRQVSVCVIDVKREASPVSYVRSEPIIVRETQVIATPCHALPEVRSVLEVQIEDGQQKEEYITIPSESRKLVGNTKGSRDNVWSPNDEKCQENEESRIKIEKCQQQPKHVLRPREVIVPIQLAGPREERPRVLELSVASSHQKQPQPVTATAACTATEPTSGIWLPASPQEAAVAGPPAATPNSPNSPSSPGVQQSDSGIIIEERTELPPSPQRLPRCYSSSETHLNTRRLLEHRNPDFTTRKCSSYDEVGRAWPHNLGPHHQQHQQGVGREGTTWLCPWELARSDSVSTSGFGSEISDTDFLHDDAHSTTTQDDALGPYDAVFADVFPGEQQQQQRQVTTPKTPRPASLPGVTGAYFSQFEDANSDPGLDMGVDMGTGSVELRHGGRGRMGMEKKDSGYYSFISEHPPVSPRTMGESVRHTTSVPWPKERPRDLRLQITNIVRSPTHDSPKTTTALPHIISHTSTMESRSSPEKRMTPEKRKSRGSSTEENEEKRRSCEADTQWMPPRQSISIGSGVRMAQELLRGVEQLLDSEMGELRRRTAAMSSRIRLLGRSDSGSDSLSSISSPSSNSSSGNSSASGRSSSSGKSPDVHTTHIIVTTLDNDEPADVKSMRNVKTIPSHTNKYPQPVPGTLITSRARSEPPFPGEEGLYRARSCPGLQRPNGSCEGNETVSALVPDLQLVRLRGSRPQASREKCFNRYSCGALDAHQPASASSFESCPDFGNLRQCVHGGESLHSSSSSLSSTHSSFTRLLQVS
ncbi:uncharacterized protein [Cherax quadricarinatus]|uniref:uncharacterized protein isoform X1 n=1 Tax=Cherax quadricarinatus TaxID=27406 RepID=UPI00387EA43E